MKQKISLSPNFSNKSRSKSNIKFVIIHYTGMQSEIESLKRLKNVKSKVSCHYLINRKGNITKLVDDNKIAWHAGKSKWKKFNNLNNKSLGIELVNKGHQYGYEKFTIPQIRSLTKLCIKFKKIYKIKSQHFLGHSDIAPIRKKDPGEKFPWKKLSKFGIGNWYKKINLNYEEIKDEKKRSIFFKNLNKIGYRYFSLERENKKIDSLVIKSFQRRYLPGNLTGKIDKKTFKICHFLANVMKKT